MLAIDGYVPSDLDLEQIAKGGSVKTFIRSRMRLGICLTSFLVLGNAVTPSFGAATQPYQAIVESLRPWTKNGHDVLLVPLMNPDDKPDFRDVYHIFPASIVLSLVSAAGQVEIARKIAEFYILLYEEQNPDLFDTEGTFRGFPEVYKDLCGSVRLCGDIQRDPGLTIRGSGPSSWLAIGLLNYINIESDPNQRARALRVIQAIADWLLRIQIHDLSRPWIDGGIPGETNENTGEVGQNPYTEGNAASYAVLRRLAALRAVAGSPAEATHLNASADSLGRWFRWVVEPTGRVYVGYTAAGMPIESLPGVRAEAVDTYAFLILAGVVDAPLALRMIDRIRMSGAYKALTDSIGRMLTGLAFGPIGDTPYWGPHGQVALAARWIGHPWAEQLQSDMRHAAIDGKLPVFVRPAGLCDDCRVRDWTGQPGDKAWVGDPQNFALEPTSWHAMLDLLPVSYNILAPTPISWSPIIVDEELCHPSTTLSLNQTTFRPGDTLRVGLQVLNPRPGCYADFYFGIVLPDGVTVFFFTSLSPLNGVWTRLDANPKTFPPLAPNVPISEDLTVTLNDIFVYRFSGSEPVGSYVFVTALTLPNAFAGGKIDPEDILALDVQQIPFSSVPQVTLQAISREALVPGSSPGFAEFRKDGTAFYHQVGGGGGRGFNIAVIDPRTGALLQAVQTFDTYGTKDLDRR